MYFLTCDVLQGRPTQSKASWYEEGIHHKTNYSHLLLLHKFHHHCYYSYFSHHLWKKFVVHFGNCLSSVPTSMNRRVAHICFWGNKYFLNDVLRWRDRKDLYSGICSKEEVMSRGQSEIPQKHVRIGGDVMHGTPSDGIMQWLCLKESVNS